MPDSTRPDRPGRPNVLTPDLEYEADDPEGYRAGLDRLGPKLGSAETGMSVYELPPGQAICPFHYEWAEEEWLVVVAGRPTLRTPDGETELAPGDVAFFPIGPAGAHKVTNATAEPVRVVMFSTLKWPAASVYPDSDKIGVFTDRERTDSVMVERAANVEYFHGELGED